MQTILEPISIIVQRQTDSKIEPMCYSSDIFDWNFS